MLTIHQATSDEVTPALGAFERGELCQLWHALLNGQARIATRGTTADCHYFEVDPNPGAPAANGEQDPRSTCLTRMLLGEAPKVLQAEIRVAASTIATRISDSLQAMGLQRRGHRTPLLLVVMAHAVHGKVPSQHVQIMRRSAPAGEGWLVWISRPELALAGCLSGGEMDVLVQLLAERNYAEIARHRRTSSRTIANQVASIYSKLEISGRAELLCYLVGVLGSESQGRAAKEAFQGAPMAAAV
jgi:DNA-binding CsgD family transcriptional regulator